MKKILLVGCGNIGFWHLYSLRKEKLFEIHILEKNSKRIRYLKKKFNFKNILFVDKNFHENNKNYDLVLLATNASERFKIFEYLTKKINFRNIIFEKVVFQNSKDLLKANKILKKKRIKSWVNCPRRSYYFFKLLKKRGYKNISLSINGFDWNMCSNAIHFLDLYHYLNKSKLIKVDYEFSNKVKRSKKNFIELFGFILFSNKQSYLMLQNFNMQNDIKIIININCDNLDKYQIIQFVNGKVEVKKNDKKINYLFPNQSDLTSLAVKQILFEGKSDLIKYSESITLHEQIFEPINKFLKNKKINCPIT